jgi:1,4-alpha-glucan branching enzyme
MTNLQFRRCSQSGRCAHDQKRQTHHRYNSEQSIILFTRDRVDEYEWKYDNAVLPPDEELVIYEIHVGDFTGDLSGPNFRGQFKNVTEKIPYLKELGVNASELKA